MDNINKVGQQAQVFHLGKVRMAIVWLVLIAAFTLLIGKLLHIQVLEPEFLISEGNQRIVRNYIFEPARGLIMDRNGKILAISMPVKAVEVDPKTLVKNGILDNQELLEKLSQSLLMDKESLVQKLTQHQNKRYLELKNDLDNAHAKEVASLKIKGLTLHDTYKRYYPTGATNVHVVGFMNHAEVGVFGAEKAYNTFLTPSDAMRTAHKDLSGQIIENLATRDGKAGGNVILSIDDRLQSFAYETLVREVKERDAESASAVLIDVNTGEILVMVNVPSFDPNDRAAYDNDKARNRAVTDTFEPGSTIKPIIALSALEHGVTSWNEVFDTRPYYVNGKLIRDSHSMDSGTLMDILKYSSNTGMAHIAQRLEPNQMLDMLLRFGFGQNTSSGIYGEVSGRLNANRSFWSEIDKATMGYGYGFSVTALQLASAYATLANYGQKLPVSMLKLHEKVTGDQVADGREVRRIHQVLETVVSEGTGTRAAINRYRIAGKTGTAKIAQVGGYADHYLSNFAGFAPISKPRFSLVVAIRDPKIGSIYGGVVAGPAFRDIMTRALQLYNVPPDK